jgi:RNA polymerase sigma-B factor
MRMKAMVTQGGYARLSDAELLGLVQSRPNGDPGRDDACAVLVSRYDNIVRSCAQRYRDTPEAAEDLMQVGYVGLMKAINNFNPEVGDSLAAYAQPCVSGEIKRHFRDRRWQVRVQRSTQELRLRIRSATAELTQQLARPPRDAELAAWLGVTEAEVAQAQLASQAFEVDSLDAPISAGEPDGRLGDLIGAEDPRLEHALDIDAVWQHCAELPPREQHLLMLRFYGNLTQEQIGAKLGISQMHVSRLLSHALTYLREQMNEAAGRATA